MARERRTRIPGIPKDAERNLETIIREFEDRIRLLERKTGRAGFVSANTAALAGEFLNVEAPAAGLTIILPEATPALRNARVTLNTRNTNPVKVVAIGGTVNGAEFVTNDSAGTFEAVCNGFDGWSLPGYVTPGGSTPTWAQVLVAGNTSGARNPTLDAGQGLVVAGGQSAGAGDIRSASDISLDAATDIHFHADGNIHVGHAGTTQEIHEEAGTIELLTDVDGVNISAATTANITAGASSTIQTATFFAVNAAGAVDLAAGSTGEFTAATSMVVTGGGNGLSASAAAFSMAAGTTGVLGFASGALQLRAAGTAWFTVGTAGGWAIGGNEGSAGQYKRSGGAGAPPTWATISIGELGAIAANTFVGNITGSAAAPTANSLATLAGAGLTYAAGIMAVGAGTGITVNANDVQLSTVIAESFFGNFTAGVAAPTARAGSSVAGAGLTYTAGGTLAVGAGTNVTVNANDVAVDNFPLSGLADQAANTFLINATALPNPPTAVAGTTVAGAGLTYSIGGILAVGAGKGITVNADDVQIANPVVQDFTTAGTSNDVVLNATTTVLRVDTGNSAWLITGLARTGGNINGDTIEIQNASNNASTGGLLSQTGSSAGNQIILPGDNNVAGFEYSGHRFSCVLSYDATDGFWRPISLSGGGPHCFGTATGMPTLGDLRKGTAASLSIQGAGGLSLVAGSGTDATCTAGNAVSFSAGTTATISGATGVQITANANDITLTASGSIVADAVLACDMGTASVGGQLEIQERTGAAPTSTAGRHKLWVDNLAPTELHHVDDTGADWAVNVAGVASNSAITTISAATTTITPATFTIPANTLRAGSCYELDIMGVFVRGATATALNFVADLMVNGVSVRNITTAATATAGSYTFHVKGLLNVVTIGAGGTFAATIQANFAGGPAATNGDAGSTTITTTAIDTTVTRSLALRCNMSAAVAATTLTVNNAIIKRVF